MPAPDNLIWHDWEAPEPSVGLADKVYPDGVKATDWVYCRFKGGWSEGNMPVTWESQAHVVHQWTWCKSKAGTITQWAFADPTKDPAYTPPAPVQELMMYMVRRRGLMRFVFAYTPEQAVTLHVDKPIKNATFAATSATKVHLIGSAAGIGWGVSEPVALKPVSLPLVLEQPYDG